MKKAMEYALPLMAAALCVMLLIWGDAVKAGVREGLSICVQVLIPSLYLFMAVAGFISRSSAAPLLSAPFSGLTRRVFRLPACMGAAILLSCIGGYPVGAKAIGAMLDDGSVTREQAQRALCFCCNAGPSFVVTAVGAGMLGSARMGGILLAAHLSASLLIGWLVSLRAQVPERHPGAARALPFGQAFVEGINGATSGMLSLCAFTVFFSAFGALLRTCGLPQPLRAAAVGLLEVTAGCVAASELPGRLPIILIPLMVSFAGFSVAFQVRGILSAHTLDFRPFLLCRALHAALTLALSYPLLRRYVSVMDAFGPSSRPVGFHTPNTPVATVLLLLACGAVLLLLTRETTR